MNAESSPVLETGTWSQWEGYAINGTFPLVRFIGGSEHSAVFLTEAGGSSGTAVIKLLAADAESSETQLAQWRAAAAHYHPHLVRLFAQGRCQLGDQPFVFVVMEYAEQTLAELLPRRALTSEEARELLPPVLDALGFLHRNFLVHGEVKPTNILVINDQVKLAGDTVRPIAGGRLSAPGDIWGLGMTLVEALTQQVPVILDERRGILALPAGIPTAFVDTVRRCLSPDPMDRPTVAELEVAFGAPMRTPAPTETAPRVAEVPAAVELTASPATAAPSSEPEASSSDSEAPSPIPVAPSPSAATPLDGYSYTFAADGNTPSPVGEESSSETTTVPPVTGRGSRAAEPPPPVTGALSRGVVVPSQDATVRTPVARTPSHAAAAPSHAAAKPSRVAGAPSGSAEMPSSVPETPPSVAGTLLASATTVALPVGVTRLAAAMHSSPALQALSPSVAEPSPGMETLAPCTVASSSVALTPAPVWPAPASTPHQASPKRNSTWAPPILAAIVLALTIWGSLWLAPPISNGPHRTHSRSDQINEVSSASLPIPPLTASAPPKPTGSGASVQQSVSTASEVPTPQVEPPSSEAPAQQPASTVAPLIANDVLVEVVPQMSQRARDRIRGRITVTVRVLVDPEGNVVGQFLEQAGPSAYFASLARDSAMRWQFTPTDDRGRRVWLLEFDFTGDGATVKSTPTRY